MLKGNNLEPNKGGGNTDAMLGLSLGADNPNIASVILLPPWKEWFLDLLDCLKEVGGKTIQEMKTSPWCLHPIDWRHANVRCPTHEQQHEYWQFRLGKSRGRIIGIKIDGLFYVVWLDAHHNLTDSEGYGVAKIYCNPLSEYERLLIEKERLEIENRNLLNLLDQKTQ